MTLCCMAPSIDYNHLEYNSSRPNIVLLLADDLGYADLSCYGGVPRTPHLDDLASRGIRLTQFYSAAPNCTPARAGLLSGRFPTTVGIYNYMPPAHPMHLRDEVTTIAEMAKEAGYRTGHFGKWHLSNLSPDADLDQAQPHDQGFDYSLGTTNNSRPSHLNPTNFVRNGQKTGQLEGYSCQIITDEAMRWLNRGGTEEPFFLYMAYHEPHLKLASPPKLMKHYEQYPEKDQEYYANVENMDLAIGRLIEWLDENDMLENTLVVFASDNGSYHRGSNGNLLGGKSFVYEGGIRVPGIIHWPDRIPTGVVDHSVASLVDIMPTVCEIMEIENKDFPAMDGVSLLPLMSGNRLERERPLSWFFYRTFPQLAMRMDDYMVLAASADTIKHTHPMTEPDMAYIKSLELDTMWAYNLADDPGQNNPLNLSDLEDGDFLRQRVKRRFKKVQEEAPVWSNLPPDNKVKKLKTEWRKLRWDSFSN